MNFLQLKKIDYNTFVEGRDLEPEVVTVPVVVSVAAIRCFYPRKQNRPGSRITFTDGGGFAVAETVEQIEGALLSLGGIVLQEPVVLPEAGRVLSPQEAERLLAS